ncbi:hypothetical protein OSB04_025000 [Centaurea solstitialis]|uniref:Uncharacterized protein n=1 Tax=Centaurea solstitialis TaxID=347529 RepID=A0AA38SMV4_9ASTR|nr:hypothetical protein OSB04_025000 [Centaurea solstitialis]
MKLLDPTSTPMELGLKFSKDSSENEVDPSTYRSMVGGLMYLTNTCRDILFSVSLISRFMECPKRSNFITSKGLLIMEFARKGERLEHNLIH